MKPTGIVRKLDDLGRIVIPKEVRTLLNIEEKDALEVFVDNNDTIILQKYVANMTCLVTGEVSDNNHRLLNGDLILSDEGAKLLVEEIEKTTGKLGNVETYKKLL